MAELVDLRLGTGEFTGWERVRWGRSIEAIAGKFELEVSDRTGFPAKVGDPCQLALGGEPVLTGFVEELRAIFDPARSSITLSGRDKTGDLVDCSALNEPGEFLGEEPAAIVAKICDPYGIVVVVDVELGEPFERFAVQPSETAFEAIERLCRLRGVLPTTDGLGRLVLTRAGKRRAKVDLVEGEGGNVKGALLELDGAGRYHRYLVRAQGSGEALSDPDLFEPPEGEAFDEAARAPRTLVVMAEGEADPKACETRARWEAAVRASRAARLRVVVQGARQAPGEIVWQAGTLVAARIPSLRVASDWLITGLSVTQQLQGTETELELARPDSFNLEAKKPAKKDPAANWGEDVDEEDE